MSKPLTNTMKVPTSDGVYEVKIWKIIDVSGVSVALHWHPSPCGNPNVVAACPRSGYALFTELKGDGGSKITKDCVLGDPSKTTHYLEMIRGQILELFESKGMVKIKAAFDKMPTLNDVNYLVGL